MKTLASTMLVLSMTAGLMAAAEEGSFNKTLTVSGPIDLDVQTDSGGITIRQGSAGTVRVHGYLKADHGWLGSGDSAARIRELERNPPIEQSGDRVRIGYLRRSGLLNNISMRLEIETPADSKVHARADSGGIHVDGVHGPVDCKTDSGGIEVNDAAATVRLVADSGGIRVRNLRGSLFAHVDSGGIDASGIAGSIDAQSDSGRLRLGQTVPAPITAVAESGGVSLTLAPGAGYDISAETGSGSISVPEITVHSAFSSHHMEGKLAGGGPLVKVRADSGSVSID